VKIRKHHNNTGLRQIKSGSLLNKFVKQREKEILKSCLQWLQCLENNGTIHYVDRLNSGRMIIPNKNGTFRAVRLCRQGTPDIMVVLNNGGMVWVECKAEGGTQEPDQEEFERMISEVPNHHYLLVRSSDDLAKKLEAVR
jgi:hypothetical protein